MLGPLSREGFRPAGADAGPFGENPERGGFRVLIGSRQ